MYHFCTLFDRNYLFKGLALHSSLREHCKDFTLHVLCMDDIAFDVLGRLKLDKVELIRLRDFEDEALREAKRQRTAVEYCWTCTPSLSMYVLRSNPSVDSITYLDADIFFFSSPEPIFNELDSRSILITEHRFSEHLKHRTVNGIYNVQFVSFRRNKNALECLRWWRDRCNEWCFNRLEDGKLGDQKYLDNWPTQFDGVHVLQHLGAGVAPWNFSQYQIEKKGDIITINGLPLIFYHFHQFRIFTGNHFSFMSNLYSENSDIPILIYDQYVAAIKRAMRQVRTIFPSFSYGVDHYVPYATRSFVKRYFPKPMKELVRRWLKFKGQ